MEEIIKDNYNDSFENEINEIKKYNFGVLDYLTIHELVVNDNMEFEKPFKDEGYYISFYRELYRNEYKYKFDFIQYKDNLKFVKDKKGVFSKQLFDEVICWYKFIL